MKANIVPEYAEVTLDLRFLEHRDRLVTEERWRKMMAHSKVSCVASQFIRW